MAVVKKTTKNNGVNMAVIEERGRGVDSVVQGNPQAERAKNDKMFTIRTSEAKQREYKAFFASKGLSISRGVQIAVDYLIDQAKRGNIELKDTGIFTR